MIGILIFVVLGSALVEVLRVVESDSSLVPKNEPVKTFRTGGDPNIPPENFQFNPETADLEDENDEEAEQFDEE